MSTTAPTPPPVRHSDPQRWTTQLRRRVQHAQQRQRHRKKPPPPSPSYLTRTRGPLSSLIFVLPMVALYEGAAHWGVLGGAAVRTGADVWVHHALAQLGLPLAWLPPVLLVAGLVLWQLLDRGHPVLRPGDGATMALESVVFAVGLVGVSRLLDWSMPGLDPAAGAAQVTGPTLAGRPVAPLIGFLGAGVYEEAIFRLALVPLLYGMLRLLQSPDLPAGTLAVTGSALAFALAHHAGEPGEAFSWYVFVFRWVAGVYFAGLFLMRGFGVAVGAHAAYDVIVGWLDWPLG